MAVEPHVQISFRFAEFFTLAVKVPSTKSLHRVWQFNIEKGFDRSNWPDAGHRKTVLIPRDL